MAILDTIADHFCFHSGAIKAGHAFSLLTLALFCKLLSPCPSAPLHDCFTKSLISFSAQFTYSLVWVLGTSPFLENHTFRDDNRHYSSKCSNSYHSGSLRRLFGPAGLP